MPISALKQIKWKIVRQGAQQDQLRNANLIDKSELETYMWSGSLKGLMNNFFV